MPTGVLSQKPINDWLSAAKVISALAFGQTLWDWMLGRCTDATAYACSRIDWNNVTDARLRLCVRSNAFRTTRATAWRPVAAVTVAAADLVLLDFRPLALDTAAVLTVLASWLSPQWGKGASHQDSTMSPCRAPISRAMARDRCRPLTRGHVPIPPAAQRPYPHRECRCAVHDALSLLCLLATAVPLCPCQG
jgi:hypothetical protein